MTNEKPILGQVQIALRIAPELRGRIKEAADRNNRSVNSELTATLEAAYPVPVKAGPDLADLAEMMSYVESAKDSDEQLVRLRSANAGLRETGHGVKLNLGLEIEETGLREVYMAIDHGPTE